MGKIDLEFSLESQKAFSFLESDFGFQITTKDRLLTRYTSDQVFIEIRYDDYEYAVEIFFGPLKENKNERFSFDLFLKSRNYALTKEIINQTAKTPEDLSNVLNKLSTILRSEGHEIFQGTPELFDNMKKTPWYKFYPEAIIPKIVSDGNSVEK